MDFSFSARDLAFADARYWYGASLAIGAAKGILNNEGWERYPHVVDAVAMLQGSADFAEGIAASAVLMGATERIHMLTYILALPYRHPLVLFGFGPAYLFFLRHRLPVGLMNEGRQSPDIVSRLAELFFSEAIRRYMDTMSDDEGGWLTGLRERLRTVRITWMHVDGPGPHRGRPAVNAPRCG